VPEETTEGFKPGRLEAAATWLRIKNCFASIQRTLGRPASPAIFHHGTVDRDEGSHS
jgi:hypothetical protein